MEPSQTPPPKRRMAVETILTPSQARRLPQWGVTRRNGILRAWSGKCSPRHAIKMQCLECVGEDQSAITGCKAQTCPLWRFRPFQNHPPAA